MSSTLFNLLMNEDISEMLKLVQRRIQRPETHVRHELNLQINAELAFSIMKGGKGINCPSTRQN